MPQAADETTISGHVDCLESQSRERDNYKEYRRAVVVIAIILAATMYEINTSSFTVIIAAIAGEMIPKGMLPTQVGWLISIPAIFMIPGVLTGFYLVRRVKVRLILICTWVLFALSGMAIYWCQTTMQIFTARAVMGFCIGLSEPMAKVLPARLYDGSFRSKVMGWLGIGGGGLSLITSLIVGQVALINWRVAMFLYPCYAVLFIVFILAWGPNLPVEKGPDLFSKSNMKKRPFGQTVWVMCVAGFVLYVVCAVLQIETSIHVSELGLGGSDVASYVSICNTAGIIVGGILFGYLYEVLKRWLFPISLLFAAGFYFLFANSTTLFGLCLTGCLANIFTIPILCVYTITRTSFAAPRERMTMAVTMVSLFWYLGQVLTTPFVNLVQSVWGHTARVALESAGFVFLIFAIVSALYIVLTRNKKLTALEVYGEE